jgi:hypothetical protein
MSESASLVVGGIGLRASRILASAACATLTAGSLFDGFARSAYVTSAIGAVVGFAEWHAAQRVASSCSTAHGRLPSVDDSVAEASLCSGDVLAESQADAQPARRTAPTIAQRRFDILSIP